MNTPPAEPPFWTELGFSQCANCPLQKTEHPHCPAALHMAATIEELKSLVSYRHGRGHRHTGGTYHQGARRLRRGDGFGARPHHGDGRLSVDGPVASHGALPPAFRERGGNRLPQRQHVSPRAGVRRRCRRGFRQTAHAVRESSCREPRHARRLGAASRTDPARNAIAILDTYTTALPAALARSLDELKPLFGAWRNAKTAVI